MRRTATIVAKLTAGILILLSLAATAALTYARGQGLQVLSVQSGSMRPAIAQGDAVVVRPGSQTIRPGDIISFRSADNPRVTITHRVVSVSPADGRYVTRGDSLRHDDPPLTRDRIIGRVERRLPLAGHSLDFMRHPLGLVVSVYLPAAALAAGEIRQLRLHYRRQHYRLHAYPW